MILNKKNPQCKLLLRILWFSITYYLGKLGIKRLINLVGFKILKHENYQVKAVNGSLDEVFTLKKPLLKEGSQ